MKKNFNEIEIIRPDDWHSHLRESALLQCVIKSTTRVLKRCIAMPNLTTPITTSILCEKYKKQIKDILNDNSFDPLVPCYLIDNMDLKDFEFSLQNDYFIGAKLYPVNSTTNSELGVTNIENIYGSLDLLNKYNKPLLIHGEKINDRIDIFDREKYFVDDELQSIRNKFQDLKIVFEHISSKYGADFVADNKNIGGTITPQHMLITKKDVFLDDEINPHNYCMPVAKDEKDLMALRKYACSGNKKFFLGTDSAPHPESNKIETKNIKPGIFSAPCSIELYAEIFDQENSIENLESFSSINGPNFYNLPVNTKKIKIIKEKWRLEEYTLHDDIRIKNFYGGEELNWKVI